MVKVSIEVRSGAARLKVAIRAESIRRAVSLVEKRYPGRGVRVRVQIDTEGCSGEDPAARAGIVEVEQPEKMAA